MINVYLLKQVRITWQKMEFSTYGGDVSYTYAAEDTAKIS